MIRGRINRGNIFYISELDETYSKEEINKMPFRDKKMLFSFMNEEELDRVKNIDDSCLLIVDNIFRSLSK